MQQTPLPKCFIKDALCQCVAGRDVGVSTGVSGSAAAGIGPQNMRRPRGVDPSVVRGPDSEPPHRRVSLGLLPSVHRVARSQPLLPRGERGE